MYCFGNSMYGYRDDEAYVSDTKCKWSSTNWFGYRTSCIKFIIFMSFYKNIQDWNVAKSGKAGGVCFTHT